jgi:hypothetical protein
MFTGPQGIANKLPRSLKATGGMATCDGCLHGQARSLWSRMASCIGRHTPRLAVHRIRRLAMPPGGYVSMAFLVARASTSVVGILSGPPLRLPGSRSLAGSPNVVGQLASQGVRVIQPWTLRQAQARAPPIPVAVPRVESQCPRLQGCCHVKRGASGTHPKTESRGVHHLLWKWGRQL